MSLDVKPGPSHSASRRNRTAIRCARCRCETDRAVLSMFTAEELCLDCKEREEQHPRYEEARRAEEEAIRRGQLNFTGIGRPEDL